VRPTKAPAVLAPALAPLRVPAARERQPDAEDDEAARERYHDALAVPRFTAGLFGRDDEV